MGENAWDYVLAVVGEEYNTGQDLLDIPADWLKDHKVLRLHWELTRASIGIEEIRTPVKINRFANPQGITTSANLGTVSSLPPSIF